jgi:hypothetical protein
LLLLLLLRLTRQVLQAVLARQLSLSAGSSAVPEHDPPRCLPAGQMLQDGKQETASGKPKQRFSQHKHVTAAATAGHDSDTMSRLLKHAAAELLMGNFCQLSYVREQQIVLKDYEEQRSVLKHTLVDPLACASAQQDGVSDVPPGGIHLYSTLCCSCVC